MIATRTSMRCTCAAGSTLSAVQLPAGPQALGCASCGGTALALDNYRRWRDAPGSESAEPAGAVAVEDCAAARACPGCARFMERVRVGATPDFRLDRCAVCALLWLDPGEWDALHAAGLARWVEEVLKDRWQRDLQAHELRVRREAVLRDKHGAENVEELARVHRWLQQQPHRDELLALLRTGW